MVNRQGSSAGKPVPFEGTAEITRKLPDIPMDHGAAFASLGKLFDTIGAEIGTMADRAAKAEGTDAGLDEGRRAFEEARPLALRRDGTIRGEATDQAAISAAEWRVMAQFHDGLRGAHEKTKGDPAAFEVAVRGLSKPVLALAGNDPRLTEIFTKKIADESEPYRRSIFTERAGQAEGARRAAADEAMAAMGLDLSRKAYLAGSDPGSSKAIEASVGQARASIDAAMSEGVITPEEGARRKRLLGDQVVEARLRGVFDALPDAASKTAWAAGLEKRWAEGDPALGALDRQRVEGLMAHMRGAARSETADTRLQTALDRRAMEQALTDDVASIRAAGVPTAGSDQRDDARIEAMLGPIEAAKWVDKRQAARDWWSEAGDLGRLPADQIAARVAALEVAPGVPDYARKARLHDEAAKEADRILRDRAHDPARAVEEAVKGVRDAKVALDPAKPETFERMVAMRLSAQEAVGIPEMARQPLTDAEARAIMAAVTKAAPGQEWKAFQGVAADVAKRYGARADVVTRQLLQAHGVDADTARAGTAFMETLKRGEAARREAARVDTAKATSAADKAMAPEPVPMPSRPVPARAVDTLRADPKLAGAFDEKYGAGLSKLYLEASPGTTTIGPDGEGWQP